jgi:hypothetical protein
MRKVLKNAIEVKKKAISYLGNYAATNQNAAMG